MIRLLDRLFCLDQRCTAVLIRHAERAHFANPADGANVPITPKGALDAASLGRSLGRFSSVSISHSPVGRCRQTAEAIAAGARGAGALVDMKDEDGRLGGPYLIDVPAALNRAGELGHRFVREWFDGGICGTLVKSRHATAIEQLATVHDHLVRAQQGLVVLVTHDWNLLAVREEVLGLRHEDDRWPGFLDGLMIWKSGAELRVAADEVVAALPTRRFAE